MKKEEKRCVVCGQIVMDFDRRAIIKKTKRWCSGKCKRKGKKN